jgi:hypothetical protein
MPDVPKRERRPADVAITPQRIVAWILIGGTGVVLVIMGIVGIVAKG